jgi:hypothetical protein
VPYGIIEIDIEELYEFCENLKKRGPPAEGTVQDDEILSDGPKIDEDIATFMKKYFLSNGVKQRFSEDDIENSNALFSLWVPVNYGVQKEIDYILKNSEMKFDIAIITNYEKLVLEELVKCQYNYKDYEYVRDALNKFHFCAPVRLSLDTSDKSFVPPPVNSKKDKKKFLNPVLLNPAKPPAPLLQFTFNSNDPGNFNFGTAPAAPAAPMDQGGGSIKNGNYKKWKSQKNNIRLSSYFKKSKKHKLKK